MVKPCREVIGEDYPLFIRISADEFLGEKGLTIDETTKVYAPLLEDLATDCSDVSAEIEERVYCNIQPPYMPRANILYLAEELKKIVSVPVIGVGRINDAQSAKEVVGTCRVDMISLARQSLADPELPIRLFYSRSRL